MKSIAALALALFQAAAVPKRRTQWPVVFFSAGTVGLVLIIARNARRRREQS
jgi:hypothetical protein